MSNRPEDDLGRPPTLIDARAAMSDDMAAPGAAAGGGDPVVVVGNRYEVRELLGSGGMCDVWRAHDPVLEREVAVKQLLPRWRSDARVRERFAAEALRVAKLSHPAIVGVLDAGEDTSGPFLVMELIEGPSLDQRLAADGTLPVEEVVQMGRAIARGLAAAHRAGIIHRDVKPGNILLDPRHGARLTDFGVAKAAADLDLTTTGEIIGTAAYLAPEQAMGQPVDDRTDIYALGCVLFECLTGQRPFGGDTPVQVASARIGVQLRVSDRVSGIPTALEDVVARAMAPDPADRWADGDELATALAAAAAQQWGPTATAARPGVAASRRPRPTTPPEGLAATAQAVRRTAISHGGDDRGRVEAEPVSYTEGQSSNVATAALPRGDLQPHPSESAQAGWSDGGGHWPGEDEPDDGYAEAPGGTRGRRTGTLATLMVVLAAVAIAGVLALALGRDGEDSAAASAGEDVAETDDDPGDGEQPLTGLVASSFDPFGGDGENDDELGALTDGDPTTQWTTVGYNSAAFGNLKPGVGVAIDLGRTVSVTEVHLLGMREGQSVELRTAEAAPMQFEATSAVAQGEGLGTDAVLQPAEPVTTRHLVVWLIAELPPDGGRFRGGFGEIEVIGR